MSEDFNKALELLMPKIINKQVDFNKQEKDCLKLVFDDIQKSVGSPARLDISCSSCVSSSMTVINNYLAKFPFKEAVKEIVKPKRQRIKK